MKRKCSSCGGEGLEPGRIQSTGRVYFRPRNARFLSLKNADIEIEGNICINCGFIMLFGDKGKVKALVSGREEPV